MFKPTFFPDITNDLHFREHILLSNRKNTSLLSNIHELIEKANLESPLDKIEPCIIRQHRKPRMCNIMRTQGSCTITRRTLSALGSPSSQQLLNKETLTNNLLSVKHVAVSSTPQSSLFCKCTVRPKLDSGRLLIFNCSISLDTDLKFQAQVHYHSYLKSVGKTATSSKLSTLLS